jgi:hypothetical protein
MTKLSFLSLAGTFTFALLASCQSGPDCPSPNVPTPPGGPIATVPVPKPTGDPLPTSGTLTYNIGTPAQVLALYPDKSWLPPYYAPKYQDIAATVAMFTKQSLQRDGIIALSVTYDPTSGNVTIVTPVPSAPAASFARMHAQFVKQYSSAALAGVTLCKNTAKCWDPTPGKQPWAMFLPLGMPLVNQLSVTFLDYPPSTSLTAGDYLNNFTMQRWESVMASMGLGNHYLYETIVDARPIAAPGSGQSTYLPDAATYFNAKATDHFYLSPMIALLADPPSNPNGGVTRPVTVLGTPARNAWATIVGAPVNVLDIGTVTLPGATKTTSWVAGNHPDVTSYQCCPGDTTPACSGSTNLIPDEQIDFQVLCITQLLQNPSIKPSDAKAACYQSWGQPVGSLPPANQSALCIQAKMDYDYTTAGKCKTQQDAQAFCAAYQNNACPPGIYTCAIPGPATPRVREKK